MNTNIESNDRQCVNWQTDGYAEFGEMEFINNAASSMPTGLYVDEYATLIETLRRC